MRKSIGVLSVAAMVVAFAASAAQAWYDGICLDNIANTSTDPHATTNGLFWINTGSGPVLLNDDVNAQFYCGATANSLGLMTNLSYDGHPTQTGPQYSTFLLSDHTGDGDMTFFGSGLFIDPYGIEWVTMVPPEGTPAYFQVQAWTGGTYNTYHDAYVASARGEPGMYVAQSSIFTNHVALGSFPIEPPTDLTNMPAMILARGLMGDTNIDGAVDITDLGKVLTNYNKTGVTWADGDFDGNGSVDVGDLSNVLTNYNKTVGASAGRLAAVPEPSALALLAAGLAGVFVWTRKSRG